MSETPRPRRPWRRRLLGSASIALLVVVADWLAASWLLWSSYGNLLDGLRDPKKAFPGGFQFEARAEVAAGAKKPGGIGAVGGWWTPGREFQLFLEFEGKKIAIGCADKAWLWSFGKPPARFESDASGFRETLRAIAEMPDTLPRPNFPQRAAISFSLHPFIVGFLSDPEVRFRGGSAVIGSDGWPRDVRISRVAGEHGWHMMFAPAPGTVALIERKPPDVKPVVIPAEELDRSVAAAIRILALPWQPVPKEADKVAREGKGWLEVKDGRRVLHLSGTAREIGYQHGKLLAPNIKRMAERILYGVGLAYSLEKGQWFLREAEKLVERQRPYIAPEYFEEMQGLAEGAGVPVTMMQIANIFPEFFHCSGAALFGKATKDGELLHARVLDYMTEVGLQDDAVLIAIERTGARRIVNVSYAGFIGSVTGMNEKQVAIGEMGGGGVGKWDGTPMSLLVRGALENSDTLEQALDYMRTHKRTCEYFYVISDGKSKSARGVAATPEKFETVAPGQADPRLPDPVEDTVLLSAGDRYKELVKKVRENYGKIGPQELIQIIKRPVAMKSNLHDVIFEPEKLALWVANADRGGPACNQPYAQYSWSELFRPAP